MKIGQAAQLTGLTISNIRFYERKGLLEPERDGMTKANTAITVNRISGG